MKRILCVEDHQDTCELVAAVLRDQQLISVATQAAALREIIEQNFDLYLIDYYLAEGSGSEVCAFIRTFDKRTPIIFWTADDTITETQVEALGAQALIRKGPHFLEELRAAASKYL